MLKRPTKSSDALEIGAVENVCGYKAAHRHHAHGDEGDGRDALE
jgi:hypothetical protein